MSIQTVVDAAIEVGKGSGSVSKLLDTIEGVMPNATDEVVDELVEMAENLSRYVGDQKRFEQMTARFQAVAVTRLQ